MKKFLYSLLLIFSLAVLPFLLSACGDTTPPEPELVSIEYYKYPTKTSGYEAFDEFDDSGLQLKATYSDGSFVILSDGWTISYVSENNGTETLHNDFFYGGENQIKIEYNEKFLNLSLSEEVEKVDREIIIKVEEFAQIKSENISEIPRENVTIINADDQLINLNYELVYCSNFENYSNYQPTAMQDGVTRVGGVPTNVGTYKVFARVRADKNYNEVVSNVVEFNIVDKETIDVFAKDGEEFFAFKEVSEIALENPAYIEFEMSENNELLYYSTFIENGYVMVFSDHMTLVSDNEKLQITYENNEILFDNGEKTLKKWIVPSYVGTYEMTVTPEMAAEYYMEMSENQTCSLEIYYDENSKDGKINFTLDCIWFLPQGNSDMWEIIQYEGVVSYSPSTQRLSFDLLDGTNLFAIQCESSTIQLENVLVNIPGAGNELSNGEYIRA